MGDSVTKNSFVLNSVKKGEILNFVSLDEKFKKDLRLKYVVRFGKDDLNENERPQENKIFFYDYDSPFISITKDEIERKI